MNRNRETEIIDLRTKARDRRARNLLELLFVFTLRPCSACGEYETELKFRSTEGGPLSSPPNTWEYNVWTRCRTCRSWRQIIANTVPDPDVPVTSTELGGEGPSQILAPEDFLREIHRLSPAIVEDPTTTPYTLWPSASEHLRRALLCANELIKFPLTEQGPLSKSAVTDMQARFSALSERYDEDFPRFLAEQEAADGPPKVPFGDINRETVRANDLWNDRGKTGEGRLVLRHKYVRSNRLPALPGTLWEDVELFQVDANMTPFEDAEMNETTWSESQLQMSRFERALLTKARFIECDMRGARFYSAHIVGAVFDECDLDGAIWVAAYCENATFLNCELLDMKFDDAVFKHCNFSKHELAATERLAYLATTKGARFEDCDFRETRWTGRDLSGATFVRCKFEGAWGKPTAAEHVVLEDCDVTLKELKKMLKL